MVFRRRAGRDPVVPEPPGGWDGLEAPVVALCHPDWRGVRVAAHSFRVPVVETADAGPAAAELAQAMAGAGVEVLVIHGFPPGTGRLLEQARALGLRTRLVLHSSPVQHGAEQGEARVAEQALALSRAGTIGRLGFVKEGLAEALAALGHEVAYVPNRVPELPAVEPLDLGQGLDVGVFAEPFWRKNVTTQMLAAVLARADRIHVMRRPDVRYLDGVEVVEHGELPWGDFIRVQASVDLNLYATLSECQPLTPVESYAAGVPCLVSRTSALFRDDPELWELTTVAEHDNPQAIADAALRLLEHRDDAVAAARASLARWDAAAAGAWEAFVAA